MKFIQCRIIGNELPPRDANNSKLACLEWIITNGNLNNVDNLWVLNNIIDDSYREKVLSLLKDQEIIEMKLDFRSYHHKKTWDEKVVCAININAARNFGVKHAQKKCDYVICLDQDCYFWQQEWENVKRKINNKPYYAVSSRRIHISKPTLPAPNGEEMLIFRNNSTQYFDETIPFGKADKVELIRRLNCPNIGWVGHMAFGEEEIEKDVLYRSKMRGISLSLFLEQLDAKNVALRHIRM